MSNGPKIFSKKTRARFLIARHVATHFIGKLLGEKKRGLADFLNAYAADGIFAVDSCTQKILFSASQCIACGLCDVVCPPLKSQKKFPAPSFVVTGASRDLTNWFLSKNWDRNVDCNACRQCEAACPETIPIVDLITVMKNKSQQNLQETKTIS